MCEIGKQQSVIVVEPLELPVGDSQRIEEPEPEPVQIPVVAEVPAIVRA